MLSSREAGGFRSARKYAVQHASSPLARDSTMQVPLTRRRTDYFSTSHHTHGLGGEAREAMLRTGLRVKRTTSSLRVIATKGSATLTAAFTTNAPVPDLDIYRKNYVRKECEFAESIPSAMCPFQFLPEDTTDVVDWERSKASENIAPEQEPQHMDKWLQDMRLKVHIRLAQKQQFCNTANPIGEPTKESPKTEAKTEAPGTDSRPVSPSKSGEDLTKKKDKSPKPELTLEKYAIAPQASRSSRRNSSSSRHHRPTSKKDRKDKRSSLPPLQRKPVPSVSASVDKPLPKVSSHDNSVSLHAPGSPLFYSRNDTILARRTYSEQDVRRVRAKARNSVGLEPIT